MIPENISLYAVHVYFGLRLLNNSCLFQKQNSYRGGRKNWTQSSAGNLYV